VRLSGDIVPRGTCSSYVLRHEERLERFEENESDVNAFLVEALVELGAKEAAPVIERAFAEGYVDPMVMGDWEDVQVELGLKSAEEGAPKQVSKWRESLLPSPPAEETFTPASSQVTHKKKTTQKCDRYRKNEPLASENYWPLSR